MGNLFCLGGLEERRIAGGFEERLIARIDAKFDGLTIELGDLRTEFRTELGDLRTEFRTELGDLRTELREFRTGVESALYPVEGDREAEKFTAGLYDSSNPNHKAFGHGILIQAGTDCYLLTAAHVITGNILRLRRAIPTQVITIRWKNGAEINATLTDDVYLPRSYVERGSRDVGLVRLGIDGGTRRRESHDLTTSSVPNAIGKAVVGHGSIFVNGTVVGVASDIDDNRLLVNAMSIPGCSGSPMFDHNRNLVGLLHGCSKHRGNTNTHSNGEDVSSYLYADVIEGVTLLRIPNLASNQSALIAAEDIEESLAAEPDRDTIAGEVSDLKQELKVINSTSSLNDLMRLLARRIWDQTGHAAGAGAGATTTTYLLNLVHRVAHRIWSQRGNAAGGPPSQMSPDPSWKITVYRD